MKYVAEERSRSSQRRVKILTRNQFSHEIPSSGGGRVGKLVIADRNWPKGPGGRTYPETVIHTPYVFPVINVIGGPAGPERNGGLWRPVKWWMFLHPPRTVAYLCQVLHAVDFNLKEPAWKEWLSHPFSEWIALWQEKATYIQPKSAQNRPDFGYPFREWMQHWAYWTKPSGVEEPTPPITFLDSGGFTLMKLKSLRKAREQLGVEETAESILDLQEQLGGDLVASLDYPVPPGLTDQEIRERQERSITNALSMLRMLWQRRADYRPIPYVAVHGTTRDNADWYVNEFFRRWETELTPDERSVRFGIAIGSMVPRSDDPRTVVEVVWGVTRALAANQPKLTVAGHEPPPVHVFGINSHLTGLLAYMGVDTFDSTTYADVAQRANYLGDDLRPIRIDRVTYETLADCNCVICEGLVRARETKALERMQEILTQRERVEGEKASYYHSFPLPGFEHGQATHSDLYALIAIHNWNRLNRETDQVRVAVERGELAQHIIALVEGQVGQRANRFRDALVWMARAEREAGEEERLFSLMSPSLQALVELTNLNERRSAAPVRTVRRYTPDNFCYDDPQWEFTGPKPEQDVLLLIACSKGKPYKTSSHQREVLEALVDAFGPNADRVHKVTMSGLYGPVPNECEEYTPLLEYDFKLEEGDDGQADLLAERLRRYLVQYGDRYRRIVAYIYFPAYRRVVERVFHEMGRGEVVPVRPRRGGKPSRYRAELLERLRTTLASTQAKGGQLRLTLD